MNGVIRFGNNSIIGEISVWELENQKYLEVEYADISKLKSEPGCYTKTVNIETTIEILKNIFKEIQKLTKSYSISKIKKKNQIKVPKSTP